MSARILDRAFVYHGAASHSTPDAMRRRLKAYAAQVKAQAKAPNVVQQLHGSGIDRVQR